MPIDAEIYYQLNKKGVDSYLPIVLIHGAGGNHLYWPNEIRRMQGFHVYSPDLPGHGKSGGYGLQDIQDYAEKILTWLDAIKIHRAVFVGHSMGGAISLTLAQEYKEHVLGLVLISTGARLKVHPRILDSISSPQTYPIALSVIQSKSFSKYAAPQLISLAQKRMKETRPSVLYGDLIACNKFDLMKSISDIISPTLVICGQEDEMTPPRYSQYLYEKIAGTHLELIPKAGHMVMLEKPQQVVNAMTPFLSQINFKPGLIESTR